MLKRAHHAVIGIVVNLLARGNVEELPLAEPLLGSAGAKHPPHLRRDNVFFSRLATQEMVEASFREAGSVEGSSIEIADTRLPGGFQGCLGVPLRHRAIQIAERGRPEAQDCELDV